MFEFAKNGVFIAIVAHGLIGVSLVWDKILLKARGTKNLLGYVFWLGAISVFGVVLVPFGYRSAHLWVIILAFGTGIIDLIAVFFYYLALKTGEASETLAVMGGFSPVATVAIGYALLPKQMSGGHLIGFALMTVGGFVMFLSENFPLKKLLPPVLLASGLMGLENVLLKVVYNHTNFVTGYVWFTIGTFVGAMALLVPHSWRKQIFEESEEAKPSSRLWYFVNRFIAGLGAFLVTYAISLTHPALVDAISGVRYAVIFLGAYVFTKLKPNWLKEEFGGWELVTKAAATCLVVAGLVLAGLAGRKMGGAGPTAMQNAAPGDAAIAEMKTVTTRVGLEHLPRISRRFGVLYLWTEWSEQHTGAKDFTVRKSAEPRGLPAAGRHPWIYRLPVAQVSFWRESRPQAAFNFQ